ncbi:MAG: hypothetical protein NTW28_27855 [Candidatus Solibacter sp.]|nr:hypothetical protein [Candidatus Solibacter sp.]
MSPISRIASIHDLHEAHQARGFARVRTRAESTKSELTLSVRTAEGDTVKLSFDATSLKQIESGKARTSEGNVSYSRASQSDSFNFKAKITGDLNQQEMSDIANLIQSLETGKPATSSLASIDAYSGAYTQTTSVTNNSVRLYA